jgi:hypothetical protein
LAHDVGRHDGGKAVFEFGVLTHQVTLKAAKQLSAILSHSEYQWERNYQLSTGDERQ